jgi:hypothetical protein
MDFQLTNFFGEFCMIISLSEKEPKIRTIPTEFAGSTQNPKKINGTPNLPTKMIIFPKKSLFSSFKVKKSQKFVWELPDGIRPGSPKNNRT